MKSTCIQKLISYDIYYSNLKSYYSAVKYAMWKIKKTTNTGMTLAYR